MPDTPVSLTAVRSWHTPGSPAQPGAQLLPSRSFDRTINITPVIETVFCQWRDSALWCAVSANYHPTSSIPAGWDCQSSPRKDYAGGPRTHAAVTVISGGRKGRGLEGNQSLASALPSNRRPRTLHHNIRFFLMGAGVGAVPSQQLQGILSALCDSLRLIQGQLFLPCYLNCGKAHVT